MGKDFEMINAVFSTLVEREKQRGAEGINDIERVVLLVWHASGIIGNGGFRYFFECGLSLPETAKAYERIGVENVVSVFHQVRELFPANEIPDNWDERMVLVEGLYEGQAELLEQLESEFFSADELMEQQLAGWIRVNKDVFQPTNV